MAKSKRRISLRDVPPGMTRVRTSQGDHLRAKRGTYKKAKLNRALKKGTVFVVEANAAAKLFKDAIHPYRSGLVDQTLWSRLLSVFLRQQNKLGTIDFGQLKPLELHTRYTLHKILPVRVVTTYDSHARMLQSVMAYEGRPNFDSKHIDGYKLTAVILFPDIKKKTIQTEVEDSGILRLEDKAPSFDVQFPVPTGAKWFVLCVRIDGYSQKKKYHTIATKGMQVVDSGTIASLMAHGAE